MTRRIVADIGGTNARLGLSENGRLLAGSEQSYQNDAYSSFDDVLETYLSGLGSHNADEMVVAVAGPVSGSTAKLTNRDWHFDEARLKARFGLATRLMNDLAALGFAAPHLGAESVAPIFSPGRIHAPTSESQALVVGIGTGFNVAPILLQNGRTSCLKAEYGHVALPHDITQALGPNAPSFDSIEELFSGRGYARVIEAHSAPEPLTLYAKLTALLARHLTLAFLPRSGIFFAGGVARHILTSDASSTFNTVVAEPFALDANLTAPVSLITDDTAALRGCAILPLG